MSNAASVTEAILGRLGLDPNTPDDTPVSRAAEGLWPVLSHLSSTGKPVLCPVNAVLVPLRALPHPTFADLMEAISAHVDGYAAAAPFLDRAFERLTARQQEAPT